MTQCVLTPNIWFVVQHPLSNLLNRCAAPCNYAIIPWLEKQQPGRMGVNVVITDYYDFDPAKFPFIKTVVLLNRKFVLQSRDEDNDPNDDNDSDDDDDSMYADAHSQI